MEIIVGTEITDDGMRLGHTWHEVEVLKNFMNDIDPDYFIEIGVHEGVLSRELMNAKKLHTKYIGIEVNCQIVRVPYDRGTLICGDCFSPEIKERIGSLPGRKMIYCDGGHKSRELIEYAPLCKSGDWILCHDFDDGTRSGFGLPDVIKAEVLPKDIEFLEEDYSFIRSNFKHTRIVGFFCL